MAEIVAVAKSHDRGIEKQPVSHITLVAGRGVEGDVHFGATIRHQSRLISQAGQPNLRQVHLIAGEVIAMLNEQGFALTAGLMGENITTAGIDLLALAPGAQLQLGQEAVIEITGLRNPCKQLDGLQAGLMAALRSKDADGNILRRGGVMATIVKGGQVSPDDELTIIDPGNVGEPLRPV